MSWKGCPSETRGLWDRETAQETGSWLVALPWQREGRRVGRFLWVSKGEGREQWWFLVEWNVVAKPDWFFFSFFLSLFFLLGVVVVGTAWRNSFALFRFLPARA